MLEAMAEPSPEGELSTGSEWTGGGRGIYWQTWRSSPEPCEGVLGRGRGRGPGPGGGRATSLESL